MVADIDAGFRDVHEILELLEELINKVDLDSKKRYEKLEKKMEIIHGGLGHVKVLCDHILAIQQMQETEGATKH